MTRLTFALACALALSLRLLSPAGFMPAWERGQLVITLCPDAVSAAIGHAAHHDHGQTGRDRQPCPFASALSDGVAGSSTPTPSSPLALNAPRNLEPTLLFERTRRDQELPPPTGPPPARLA